MPSFIQKVKNFVTSDKAKEAAVTGAELTSTALSAKAEIVGAFSDAGGAVLNGASIVTNTVSVADSLAEVGGEAKKLGKAAMEKMKLKDAKKDPEVKELLQQREHNSTVLIMHQNEIAKVMQKMDANTEMKAKIQEQLEAPDSGLSEDDIAMATEQIGSLDRKNMSLQGVIDKYNEASELLDNQITEINQNPKIANLRILEAKVDLASEVLKDKKTSVKAMLGLGEKAVGTVADSAGLILNVAEVASIGGNALNTVGGIVAPGLTIATSAVQGGVAGVNLAFDIKEYRDQAKMQGKAHDARGVAGAGNPQLEAAFKCIELNAKHTKYIAGAEAVKDAAAVGTAVAGGVAGTALLATAVAGAASAPGFGAGAVAPAVVTAGAAAVGVGCAAVTATTAAGVYAAKKGIQMHNDNILKEAQLGLSGLDKLIKLAENPDNAKLSELPLTQVEQNCIKNLQDYAVQRNQKDPTKGLSREDAGNLAKLREYAECRAITRENKLAIDVLSKELMWECKDALLKRKATPIVMADLPKNSPAVDGLRMLGLNDREIVGVVNAVSHLDTRELGHKNLQKKTGLAM